MKRILLWTFGILLSLFMAGILGLWIFSRIHHKTTHQEIVGFLNHHLNHQVHIGDFNLSLIKSFPNILLELDDIRIHDGQQEILKVGELDLVINVKNLQLDSFELSRIIASQVVFRSVIDENGHKPVLFKKQDQAYRPRKKYLSLESHDLELVDAQLFFENKVKGNRAYISVVEGQFDFEMKDRHILIVGDVKGKIDSLISNRKKLFSNIPVTATNASITIDQEQQLTHISGDKFYAHGLQLKPEIEFKKEGDGQTVDLVIEGENDFDRFMDLINLQFGFKFKQVNPDAHLKLAYRQHGFVNPFVRPYSEVDFEITDAILESESLPYPVTDVWLKGNLNNGEDHDPSSSNILIDTLSASISDSYIQSRFHLTHLNDPFIDGILLADINLAHLLNHGKMRSSGHLEANLSIRDKISELKEVHINKEHGVQGSLKLTGAVLEIPGENVSVRIPGAEIRLLNHQVSLPRTSILLNNSTLHLQARLQNLQNALQPEEKIHGNIQIDFNSFNMNNLISEKHTVSKRKKPFKIPRVHLNVGIQGRELFTDAGKFNDLRIKTVLDPSLIEVPDFQFKYQAGTMKGNLKLAMAAGKPEILKGSISGSFSNINLDELKFSKNRSGIESGNNKLPALPADTEVHFDLKVAKGRLQGKDFNDMELIGRLYDEEIKVDRLKTHVMGGQFLLYADAKFSPSQGLWYLKANGNTRLYHLKVEELLNGQTNKKQAAQKHNTFQMPGITDIQLGFQVDTLEYGDFSFHKVKTGVSFNRDHFDTDEFTLTLPNGKVNLNLYVKDYLKERPFIRGQADLRFDTLKIESILEAVASFHPQKTALHQQKLYKVPGNLDLTLHIESDLIKYRELETHDFQVDASLNNETLMIDHLMLFYKNSPLELYGSLANNSNSQITGHLYNKMEKIPVEDVLYSFDNFNQNQFTNQNTSGNISWEADYYMILTNTLQPLSDQNYLKFDFSVENGVILDNEMINKALFFIGHNVKEEIHIHNVTINSILYKDWILIKDVRINNSISNMELFGRYNQSDSLMDVHLSLSLTDLFFRSGDKRKIQTDEGMMNLERDANLFIDLTGNLTHQKIRIRNKRKYNAARKDQLQVISQVEKEFQNKVHQFYQNREYVLANRKINSTFDLSMD